MEVGGEAFLAEARFQPGDVVAQPRPDKGVEQRRGKALEFAELRCHLGRGADKALGRLLANDVASPRLVRRVEVGEQEADRDRLDAIVAQRSRRLSHPHLIERYQHLALGRNETLRHRPAVAPAGQRPVLPRHFLADRIMLRPLVAPDMDDVAIAFGGDHSGDGAIVLENRVGSDRRPVQHVVDRLARQAGTPAQFANASDDPARRVVRRGRHLVDQGLAGRGIGEHDIGEGAADIHSNEAHACLTPPCRRRNQTGPAGVARPVPPAAPRRSPRATGRSSSHPARRSPASLHWSASPGAQAAAC